MFKKEFAAELKAVSSKVVKVMAEGLPSKESYYKITLSSNDIGFDDIKESFEILHRMITASDVMQFKSINFGFIHTPLETKMIVTGRDQEGMPDLIPQEISPVKITNMSVINKENIPTFIIQVQIPKSVSGKYLLTNLKNLINVKFEEPQDLFSDGDNEES